MSVSAIDISGQGMRAQRLRMQVIANNLANVDTTSAARETYQGPDGEFYTRHSPYRRKEVVFEAGRANRGELGVTTPRIVDDLTDFRRELEPGHEHAVKDPADANFGQVFRPNVNPIIEMVDMIAASRAYEANVTAVETYKAMAAQSLRILA